MEAEDKDEDRLNMINLTQDFLNLPLNEEPKTTRVKLRRESGSYEVPGLKSDHSIAGDIKRWDNESRMVVHKAANGSKFMKSR